jgi:lipoyl(octanoyl) transferase
MKTHDLSFLGIEPSEKTELASGLVIIQKKLWDFEKAWKAQKELLKLMDLNGKRYVIFTSHPHVLTYGRGLQKPRKGEELELIETPIDEITKLPFPFYQIERGGGLTFHHPGQIVIYPLLRLHPQNLGLSRLVEDLLSFSQKILEAKGMKNLTHAKALLGLWQEDKKIGSVGIAVDKMKTYHGMALNLSPFHEMKDVLRHLAPCGLDFSTYSSVKELSKINISFEEFASLFIKEITDAW